MNANIRNITSISIIMLCLLLSACAQDSQKKKEHARAIEKESGEEISVHNLCNVGKANAAIGYLDSQGQRIMQHLWNIEPGEKKWLAVDDERIKSHGSIDYYAESKNNGKELMVWAGDPKNSSHKTCEMNGIYVRCREAKDANIELTCPLLVLVEGSSSGRGESIEELYRSVISKYQNSDIRIMKLDSDPYWKALSKNSDAVRAAAYHLQESGYGPIAIIGHSLGGNIAVSIARIIHTALLVTMDPVVRGKNKLLKSSKMGQWIHIIPIKGLQSSLVKLASPITPLLWGKPESPDRVIPVSVGHSDVEFMYPLVEKNVNSVLKSKDPWRNQKRRGRRDGNLCKIPGGSIHGRNCPI